MLETRARDMTPENGKRLPSSYSAHIPPHSISPLTPLPSNGQSAAANYGGPACLNPQATTCGLCFKVDNYGDIATQPPATTLLGSATVQIIDACPAGSAYNYCKTETAGNQRCGDGTTNSLDIDEMAYQQLTGTGYNETVSFSLGECFLWVQRENERD